MAHACETHGSFLHEVLDHRCWMPTWSRNAFGKITTSSFFDASQPADGRLRTNCLWLLSQDIMRPLCIRCVSTRSTCKDLYQLKSKHDGESRQHTAVSCSATSDVVETGETRENRQTKAASTLETCILYSQNIPHTTRKLNCSGSTH